MKSFARKTIAAMLIAAMLLSWLPPAASAEPGTGVITGAGVNIRSAPGGPVIGVAARGEAVTVEELEGHYYRIVTSRGLKGYVYRQYITVTLSQTGGDKGGETVLRKGCSGLDVVSLQTRLRELGYYTHSKITGYFGSITYQALSSFQTVAGLAANGVAGAETMAALYGENARPAGSPSEAEEFDVNQTLRVGSRGADAALLQTRLRDLGYYTYSKITGYFGTVTRDAVRKYQDDAGLPTTGIADPATLSLLFGIQLADTAAEYTYIAMRTDITLRKGRSGDDVRDMQTALTQKGYYSGPVNGVYDSATLYAVLAFQRAMGLTRDGLAGNYTLSALYSMLSPPDKAPQPGRFDNGEDIGIELLRWSEASKVIPRNTNCVIVDIQTGYTFEVSRTGGTRHADVEPLTALDTATLYAIYGNTWSWERRPIWVIVNGRRLAASMNGMPHGYDTIDGNGMAGQVCVHFIGSRTHGTGKIDPEHQACIRQAYEAGLAPDGQ